MRSSPSTTSGRRDAGIDGIITMPWVFYCAPDASVSEKIDGMRRFRKDLGLDT